MRSFHSKNRNFIQLAILLALNLLSGKSFGSLKESDLNLPLYKLVLDYEQLVTLDPDARAHYLVDLLNMMTIIESVQDRQIEKVSSNGSTRTEKKQLGQVFWNMIVGASHAEEKDALQLGSLDVDRLISHSQLQVPDPKYSRSEEAPNNNNKVGSVKTFESFSRQEGDLCLFGAYPSKVEKQSSGKLVCPRPPDTQCRNKPTNQNFFQCQTYGLAESGYESHNQIKETFCLPLQPLKNLTMRCVDRFRAQAKKLHPKLSKAEYNIIKQAFRDALKQNRLRDFCDQSDLKTQACRVLISCKTHLDKLASARSHVFPSVPNRDIAPGNR